MVEDDQNPEEEEEEEGEELEKKLTETDVVFNDDLILTNSFSMKRRKTG